MIIEILFYLLKYFGFFASIMVFHELGHLVHLKIIGENGYVQAELGKDVAVVCEELKPFTHKTNLLFAISAGFIPIIIGWIVYFSNVWDFIFLFGLNLAYIWFYIQPDIKVLRSIGNEQRGSNVSTENKKKDV